MALYQGQCYSFSEKKNHLQFLNIKPNDDFLSTVFETVFLPFYKFCEMVATVIHLHFSLYSIVHISVGLLLSLDFALAFRELIIKEENTRTINKYLS